MKTSKRGNGEGSIYQERGMWVAVVSYRDAGKLRRKKVYRATQREAQAAQAKLRSDLALGVVPLDERLTLADYLVRWLDERKPHVRERTWQWYADTVRLYLAPHLGHVVLARLTPHDVTKFMRRLLDDGKSASLVRHVRNTLRAVLTRAMKDGLVVRNVAALADAPRVVRNTAGFLSPDEVVRLLDATKGDRLAALWILAIGVGLRRGELVGLRWQDIDLDTRTLRVEQQIQRMKGRGLVATEPKSRESRRVIKLPASVVAALREHRARQAVERLAAGPAWTDTGLVFTTEGGNARDPRNILRRFQEALTAAGLPKRKLHECRHTAASLLFAEGVAGRVVQEILGHSDIRLTLATYTHVMPALHDDAMSKMDAVLSRGR